ncbi:hypothetical protein PUMCH_001957 [Australozyma saopauloensis]|uniref:Myb-like domain-containing protein n=1 Tax=Australozyma saopauloensis TaxID=291208 RepID=A0AAX4HAD5_9ASCO|nr:hypothetical protein PUMCH_001957 [[Candida] saopauloensis]
MSSVVRKGSHFTPKVKKRPVRKQSVAPTPPATQNSGQVDSTQQTPTKSIDSEALDPKSRPLDALSPPSTQTVPLQENLLSQAKTDILPNAATSQDSDGASGAEKAKDIEEPAVEDFSDGEDYGDNDIFKKPFVQEDKTRRRSSAASHRRLSGLGSFRGSISGASGPLEADQESSSPMNISIPTAKPPKKRRQSASSRAVKIQRTSIVAAPEELPEEQDEDGEQSALDTSKLKKEKAVTIRPVDYTTDITVGICPVTNKLRKFRTSAAVLGHEDLPVAPPDLITTITDIRQIPKNIDISDEDLFSKVHILADELSLAELCKPTIKIGTTTENFNRARQAQVKIAARREERRNARALARKEKISYEKALRIIQGDLPPDSGPKKLDIMGDLEDEPEPGAAVQITLIDGKFQVDQESTVLSRNPAANTRNREVEIENPFENPINSSSFTRVAHTDTWTQDEVMQLYKALSTWGPNFTFITQLFPHRTRKQVKRKFAAEEKKNPQLIDLAIKRKLPMNIEDYTQALPSGEKLKSMTDFEKEMEKVQQEHQKLVEEIHIGRQRAIKEDLQKKESMVRNTGMSRREVKQALRRNEEVVGDVDDIKLSGSGMDN